MKSYRDIAGDGGSGILDGALVADLFAGSGAVGIEALSRGAERCVFVERDRNARYALEDNLEALDLGDRSKVISSDVMAVASSLDCDIVFVAENFRRRFNFTQYRPSPYEPNFFALVSRKGLQLIHPFQNTVLDALGHCGMLVIFVHYR